MNYVKHQLSLIILREVKMLKGLRNSFLVIVLGILISACSTTATKKTVGAGDVYTGTDTVKYLATGVADRVFFATNSSKLTAAATATLDKQADYIKSSKISVVIEGHADERGTREYNLALGERRANAVRDYLMSKGIAKASIKVISYGKERPVNTESSALAWSQNRRSVTVKSK
jgi:peptidoglycan-associated lipoprotein